MMTRYFRSLILSAAALVASAANANPIELTCYENAGWHNCTLTLEKISPAKKRIDILDLEQRLLSRAVTDKQGVFRYEVPVEPFFLLVDAGPGHVFDIDLSSANYYLEK